MTHRTITPKGASLIIAGIFVLILALSTCHDFFNAPAAEMPIEKILDDTLQINQGKIPDDGDSTTVFEKVSLYRWHEGRVVAIKPNKTWHWLILDRQGWFERKDWRDSL